MKVKKKHYEESMEYLREISNSNFCNTLKYRIETLAEKYRQIESEKKKLDKTSDGETIKELEEEMNNISLNMRELLHPYKKIYFRNHVNRVIAYLNDINIEQTSSMVVVSVNDGDTDDYQTIVNATNILEGILINSTVLAMVYGCTRQNINTMLLQNKLQNSVIGHVTAFKLVDVI